MKTTKVLNKAVIQRGKKTRRRKRAERLARKAQKQTLEATKQAQHKDALNPTEWV